MYSIEHNECFVCREKYGDKLESNEDLRLVISRVSLSCVDQVCSKCFVSSSTFYFSVFFSFSPLKLCNIFEVILLPQVGGSYALSETRLRSFGVIVMKKYLDAVSEKERTKRELEALFSLQKLVSSLEHPNKLLHSIFDILYECDVISEVGVYTTRVHYY